MKSFVAALMLAVLFASPISTLAAKAPDNPNDPAAKLQWRNIGPFIGGRVVAIAGVPSQPDLFYMGGVQGGIWKSTDYGQSWTNISDDTLPGIASPIGALAVAQSNPSVIYAGTGEADIRGDFDTGDGIYKSTDAGKTWKYAGLRETHMTSALAVDPRNANVAYASSMGHVFKPNSERGVFKTTDGGRSWKKVLFVDDNTGGVDVVLDEHHPDVVYAAMWQAQRVPWKLTSGGPGSGLFKSTDGGAHWANISKHPGFASGIFGKIGVAVSRANPRVVYAIVQAADGGVFRSNDGGATWQHVNSEWKLRQRAFYYTAIFADPVNANVAYVPEVDGLFKTTDGGKTWKTITPAGDHHIVWVNPNHPNIMLEGNDGGAMVSVNGGQTWSTENNQPTGQFYHVALDNEFPFNVYGAQQDEGAYEGASASAYGSIGMGDWHTVALGESTFVAPEPGNQFVTFGSGYYSSMVRLDRSVGQAQSVSPWPRYMPGNSADATKYRFGWTHPIFFSPANSKELLVGAQVVFSSLDRGQTWKILSPDLTRNEKSTEGPSGGPVYLDQTGAETFPDIASLAVSPKNADVLWAGSADGLVHVTTDHGGSWQDITPPQLPQWAQISSIEPSQTNPGTAYLSASRYMWDDFHPYVYRTSDYGKHWTQLTNGIPADQYVFAVREDPREPRLLFAGTRSTVYVSYDAGGRWQPLTLNLPGVQVRDLAINARQGQVVAATHGRAFWILDNLALLEQLTRVAPAPAANVQLFAPETAWLTHVYGNGSLGAPGGNQFAGDNPDYGVSVYFKAPQKYDGKTPMTLTFRDAKGNVVRSFQLHAKNKHEHKPTEAQQEAMDANQLRRQNESELTGVDPGMNVFLWDMRYAPAQDVPGFRISPTDDFPDKADGPTIVPGAYSVELQYGATKDVQNFNVSLDPRLHPAAGDLEARLALEQQILGTIDSLDRTITAAIASRGGLSGDKRSALDAEVGTLVQLDIHSSEADVLHPSKVREQLAFLMNSLENAYERPRPADYATYEELKGEADAGASKLRQLMGRQERPM